MEKFIQSFYEEDSHKTEIISAINKLQLSAEMVTKGFETISENTSHS
jgi:hypothetical protein